jgi:hypothetical protein
VPRRKTALKLYASLVGPLQGLYHPLPPAENEREAHLMLNTSKLRELWCSVYTEEHVDANVVKWPHSVKLPDHFATYFDFDSFAVDKAMGRFLDCNEGENSDA